MQEFPREEKRRLRSQRAENDAQRNAAAGEAARVAVERDAATAWLARRFAADTQRVIAEQIAEAELGVASIGAAYRAGRAPQADLIAAQSMLIELRNRATEAAAQSRRASIALARFIGAEAERPPGEAPDMSRLPFDVAAPARSRAAGRRAPRAGAGDDRAYRRRARTRGEAVPTGARSSRTRSAARRTRT